MEGQLFKGTMAKSVPFYTVDETARQRLLWVIYGTRPKLYIASYQNQYGRKRIDQGSASANNFGQLSPLSTSSIFG